MYKRIGWVKRSKNMTTKEDCVFCNGIKEEEVLLRTDNFIVVFDINPIQQGHLLILSKRHCLNIRELSHLELTELILLEQQIVDTLERNFNVDGVTIALNNGTIMDEGVHFHVHVIPRYKDDEFWDTISVKEKELSQEKLKSRIGGV